MYYYFLALQKYATFKGRASRAEFWYFSLIHFIIIFAIYPIAQLLFVEDRVTILFLIFYFLLLLVPFIALHVRRLHDIWETGWVVLIKFIPVMGSLCLLVLLVIKGDETENKYGPIPRR